MLNQQPCLVLSLSEKETDLKYRIHETENNYSFSDARYLHSMNSKTSLSGFLSRYRPVPHCASAP